MTQDQYSSLTQGATPISITGDSPYSSAKYGIIVYIASSAALNEIEIAEKLAPIADKLIVYALLSRPQWSPRGDIVCGNVPIGNPCRAIVLSEIGIPDVAYRMIEIVTREGDRTNA